MKFLDKVVEVLGDEPCSLRDYQKILEAGLTEIQVGLIPPASDQVLVGDIERTRLKHIKYLFFVGLNEGLVPKPVSKAGSFQSRTGSGCRLPAGIVPHCRRKCTGRDFIST